MRGNVRRGGSGRGRSSFARNTNGRASFPVSHRGKFRGAFRNTRSFNRGRGRLLRTQGQNDFNSSGATSSGNQFGENYNPANRQNVPNRMRGNMRRPNPRGRARGFNARSTGRPVRGRGNRSFRQNDASISGVEVYDHTRLSRNSVRRRPLTRFNNQIRGNVHKRNVPFAGNSQVSDLRNNERPTYRGNFLGRKRRMPKFKNNRKLNAPAQKKRKSEYNPGEESRLEKIVFGDTSEIINNLPDDAIPEYMDQDSDKDTNADTEVESEENANSDADDIDNGSVVDDSEHETIDLIHDNDIDNAEAESNDIREESCESEGSSDADDSDNDNRTHPSGHAAWVDEDDIKYTVSKAVKTQKSKIVKGWTETHYSQLLENRYKKLIGTPKWAELNAGQKQDTDEIEDEILKHSCHIAKSTSRSLPKTSIELKAMSLLNKQTHNEGPIISSMEFHPTSTVGLVGGSSGIVSIFQVDGVENNKLHSMLYRKFPISKAKFIREGTEVLLGSQFLPYCHCYNLFSGKTHKIPLPHGVTSMKRFEISPDGKLIALCGRTGEIYLLTTSSKELVGQLKMNAKCRALAFTPDSKTLISHGDSNEMYIWDVNSRSCVHRAVDDGCLSCESIAMSPNGQFVATGSKQGVVNVYETDTVVKHAEPTPLKVVLNLVTPITSVKFNPTSEILAMASNKKPNAFKMMHIPSFNIFPNFPTNQTRLNMPEVIEFSPGSGYLGISNRSHSAFLFRLKHYENY